MKLIKVPKIRLVTLTRQHKDSELIKQSVLESNAFPGVHVSTKSPQSCHQDQLDAIQKRMCSHSHLARFGNRGAIKCLDNFCARLQLCDIR